MLLRKDCYCAVDVSVSNVLFNSALGSIYYYALIIINIEQALFSNINALCVV